MSKLQLKGNFILVKPDEAEERTASGIILPEQTRENQRLTGMTGTVVAVGDGTWVEKMQIDGDRVVRNFEKQPIDSEIQINARVLFPKYAGMEISVEGVKYLLVKEFDIQAVIS
jgi:chaperonin GroES